MSSTKLHLVQQPWRLEALGLCLAAVTGCQSLSNAGTLAHVRIIDVSPDTAATDIYQGNAAVAYNLTSGTVTSYLPVVPGASTLTIDAAGSRQVLSAIEGTFVADTHYTVLIGGYPANAQPMVLVDHGPLPVAKGQTAPTIRFIHQAMRTGAVDIYLVPAGQRLGSVTPLVTNLAIGSNTGYISVAVCNCTAVMLPAGTAPSTAAAAVHSGAQSSYLSGSARTVILLDAPSSASSRVQVVTATDAEPAL